MQRREERVGMILLVKREVEGMNECTGGRVGLRRNIIHPQ